LGQHVLKVHGAGKGGFGEDKGGQVHRQRGHDHRHDQGVGEEPQGVLQGAGDRLGVDPQQRREVGEVEGAGLSREDGEDGGEDVCGLGRGGCGGGGQQAQQVVK